MSPSLCGAVTGPPHRVYAQLGTAMDLMHAPTGSIMFVAVYWVTFATVMSPATASLIVAPVYLAPVREARLPLASRPPTPHALSESRPKGA